MGKRTDTEKHLMPNVIDEVAISEQVILKKGINIKKSSNLIIKAPIKAHPVHLNLHEERSSSKLEYFLISATLNKAFLLSKNTELGKFLHEYYQSIGIIFFLKRKVNDNAVVEGECWECIPAGLAPG